ncbi:MAG: hypothetical protein RMJ66_07450 [Bacteroidia bacterium]|nr:hypothetical protein [Bacteroidia bacterium]MDW8134889.1 hypothetical protein [Bacteroidia bacterium]
MGGIRHALIAAFSTSWVWIVPDSVFLGVPFWTYKKGDLPYPQGPELIEYFIRSDTSWAYLRFWEGPGKVKWSWGKETLYTYVGVYTLPPDSLMPKADFRVPSFPAKFPPISPERTNLISVFLALILVGALFLPFILRYFREKLYYLLIPIRWYLFLWRWKPHINGDYEAFIRALGTFLRPFLSFHPGALTPSEIEVLQLPPPLKEALRILKQSEYEIAFLGISRSPQEQYKYWLQAWQNLKKFKPRKESIEAAT